MFTMYKIRLLNSIYTGRFINKMLIKWLGDAGYCILLGTILVICLIIHIIQIYREPKPSKPEEQPESEAGGNAPEGEQEGKAE